MGLPQITVVHGSATAGGAYQPGLSDYVVVVRGKAKLFLAGPPLLKAATGEVATDEELGGAEMHAQTAGTAEYLAENDADGVRQVREIMSLLPWNDQLPWLPERQWEEPLYPIDELLGLIPDDPKKTLRRARNHRPDCRRFELPRIQGRVRPANNLRARADSGSSLRLHRQQRPDYAQRCEQGCTVHSALRPEPDAPAVFFHNTTGFMVGTESEQQGVIKHGAKMIQAVANARVPKLTIVVGGSYGAGNYAMCGRGLDPRFIFAWPNSRTAVMGGAQAGKVLRIVTEAKQLKDGLVPDPKNARHAGTGHHAETRQPVHRAVWQRQSVGRRADRSAGHPHIARVFAGYLS